MRSFVGRAGIPLSITAAFLATSEANWEPLVAEQVYTFTPPLNFVGIQLEVQYQDTQGTESPVYCDDITVEGMP